MDEEYLLLSGIQHFCFCRRQWALIHLEQQWQENLRTAEGRLDHSRCHDDTLREKRGNLLTVRGMRVVSHTLKLSGICDVVEFHAHPDGVPLQGREGLWLPLPVEYKHGIAKQNDADRLQLVLCRGPATGNGGIYPGTAGSYPPHRCRNERLLYPGPYPQGAAGQALQRLLFERIVSARSLPEG